MLIMAQTLVESPLSILQELYFCFCILLQRASHFLTSSWDGWRCPAKINATASMKELTDTTISWEDLGSIMGNIGIIWDKSGGERLDLIEISDLFSELTDNEDQTISLEEVKEAFELFDENRDGFIDAKELQKMLRALGFKETTETYCQKMISVFDCNGDRRIDFSEFLKVVESSFC